MEELSRYRRIVSELIQEYAQFVPSVGDIQTEAVLDEANDHYELVHTGWVGNERVDGAVIHIDIRDGKIWIQHNGTEDMLGDRLFVGMGSFQVFLPTVPIFRGSILGVDLKSKAVGWQTYRSAALPIACAPKYRLKPGRIASNVRPSVASDRCTCAPSAG